VENAPITLEPKIKKEVSFMVPKAKEPQIYNVLMSLKSDTISSNNISFNYSIKGVNATIQNITLDKESYSKGDTAKINILWLSSLSNTTNSSFLFEMKMKEGYNNCIKPVSKVLNTNENNFLTLEESIISVCKNPTIKAVIKDSSTGKILSEKEFVFSSQVEKEVKEYVYYVIFIGLLIVLGLSNYFIKLKNKKNEITNIQ
jgi:hypothetical protein